MSLIPLPKIPNVLGAPIVKRVLGLTNEVNYLVARLLIAKALLESLFLDIFGQQWTIVGLDGSQIIPDSVISFEYRNEAKVSEYPVDPNSFSSYNKVASPFDIRLVMTCGGKGEMTREAFIAALDGMLASTDLWLITTPDQTYQNVNMIHYDFKREAKSGVTLLTVECWFQEIRQTASATTKETQTASGADSKSLSMVTTSTPSSSVAQSATGVT